MYQIIDGAGTLVTGGHLDPPVAPENPDLVRTKSILGGVTRKVAKGDVIVMPPGTPHWFSAVDGAITIWKHAFPSPDDRKHQELKP